MLDFIWEDLLAWLQTTILSTLDMININMLYAFSPQLITLDTYFPMLTKIWDFMVYVSFAMVLALLIFKVFQNYFLVFSKNYEHPGVLILRSGLAFVVITFFPYFMRDLFNFAGIAYWEVLKIGDMESGGESLNIFTDMCKTVGNSFMNNIGTAGTTNPGDMIADLLSPTDNIAAFLLSLCLTIAIAWNYFKLALEIAERYVVLGIMYYIMPLAAVPIVSRETSNITKQSLRMVISELMILVLNVWFLVVFKDAIVGSAMTKHFIVNGKQVGGGLVFCFVAIAFLKTAQRIDSHVATLGLTTAQLGTGVAGAIMGAAGGMLMTSRGIKNSKMFSPGKVGGVNFHTPGQKLAASKIMNAGQKGKPISDAKMVKGLKGEQLMDLAKNNGISLKDGAAAAAIKDMVPSLKDKDITEASLTDKGFSAKYKDANGKEAEFSFTTDRPDGISKAAKIGNTDGYVKDTGIPYSFDDVNGGTTSFQEFADKHLNGNDNFISESGAISPKDLEGATIGAAEDGDGFVIRDKDGFELAHVMPFDDAHTDNMDHTLIGEGADGLYRADINTDIKPPLPEGYSYAGEVKIGGEDGYYQNSYMDKEGNYISANEMSSIIKQNTVSNADYAGNMAYDNDSSQFKNNKGEAYDMNKTGWLAGENGTYTNRYTGGTASGEEIAEHMSNPEFSGQSYGGIDAQGQKLYYDNYSKEKLSETEMASAPKYGDIPSDMNSYYNPVSGDFGQGTNVNSKSFGESVEGLLEKDYSFAGEVGGKIAKAYMPGELGDVDVAKAYMDKDVITVDRHSPGKPDNVYTRNQYMSQLDNKNIKGTYENVESSGQMNWIKTHSNAGKAVNSDTKGGPKQNDAGTNDANDNGNRGGAGGIKKRKKNRR